MLLDLTHAPSTLFFFGLAGSGKSYVGNLIEGLAGWHIYHADADITEEMALALKEHRPFTNAMRDHYIELISDNILALQEEHENLVVTQAVYKQKHRNYLMGRIPNMEMIWVDASDSAIQKRIAVRADGVSSASAAALRLDFELPPKETKMLKNDGDAANIVFQLNRFYSNV